MAQATPSPEEDASIKLGGDSTKKCVQCGSSYSGATHEDCPAVGATLKNTSSGPPSGSKGGTIMTSKTQHIDDIPAEAAPFANDPSRVLNQYILVKQIGKGGMGAVFKAWDRKLTRWIAIKFLLAGEEEDVARFQREAKLAARLRHPNIAPIYEVGEAPSTQAGTAARYFLAMEYIDGTSLASALSWPLNELLDIFMKVAQGVEAAHKAGVIHRDLKPQNVMLTSDKWPYVMDFGLAKAMQAESSLSVSGAVMGTPAYMPPEQAQGQLDQVDAQSDVYSLGATMYAVLSKKQPFTGQTPMEVLMKVCREEPIAPRKQNPELPEEVERIVLKAMAKEKNDRYASSGALAEDIKRYLSNQPIEAQGPSSMKLAARRMKRNMAPLAVVAALLVAGGAVAWVMLRKPPPPPPPVVDNNPKPPVVIPGEDPAEAARRKAAEERRQKEEDDRRKADAAKLKREELEQKWQDDWLGLRTKIDFDRWDPKNATLGATTNGLLLRMKAEAARKDQADASDKLDEYARSVADESSRLDRSDRAKAARVVAWCDMFAAAVKGVDDLKAYAETAARARTEAVKIAQFKGTVTIRVAPAPFAEVLKITRDGQPIELTQRSTPLSLQGVEIGAIEIELAHPQHGKKTVKIDASKLKDTKTYVVSGRLQDPALKLTEQ
ncbi:MAG TPA: protein kinase [Planctomycetota bacterium]